MFVLHNFALLFSASALRRLFALWFSFLLLFLQVGGHIALRDRQDCSNCAAAYTASAAFCYDGCQTESRKALGVNLCMKAEDDDSEEKSAQENSGISGKLRSLAACHGLKLRELEDGKIAFYSQLAGQEIRHLDCGKDSADPAALELLLQKRERELRDAIKTEFGIDTEKTSEYVTYTTTNSIESNYKLRLRNPNLQELECLQYALQRSAPSQFIDLKMKRVLAVYFLMDSNVCGTLGQWGIDSKGKPAIFVEPESAQMHPLEITLIHEFGHNAAYRLGWRPDNSMSWKLLSKLGWKTFYNANSGEIGYLICTKDGSGIEKLYKFISGRNWIRCNSSGQPVDPEGRICKARFAERKNTDEIRQCAIVKPASSYCPNPMEVFAEAVAFYRGSKFERKLLLERCRVLYDIVKEHDSCELERSYGKAQYARDLSGRLVAANENTLAEIWHFENPQTVVSMK